MARMLGGLSQGFGYALVDQSEDELRAAFNAILDLTFDFNLDGDSNISLLVHNIDHFHRYKSIHPLYRNIAEEGVIIYGERAG